MRATRGLPWAWKPTISRYIYAQGAQFDPRSRCFAFEDDRLVGYMSFTGQGKFVSLGYPWVLPGYEGTLQETLYERVYGFAASPEYSGTTFAQRFRQPWPAQVSFFERHGFTEAKSTPVYALDVRSARIPEISIVPGIEIRQGFRWEDFRERASGYAEEELKMFELYFRSVDFDFSVTATSRSGRAAHLGFAIRPDTGFAELIAVARDPGGAGSARALLSLIASRVKVAKCSVPGNRPCPGGRRFRDTAAHGIQPGQ
jgi:GNAT superfamily N-acetyltransferase